MKKIFSRKTKPTVGSTRVALDQMFRFNPLRTLSPDTLRVSHDEFDAGSLRSAARLWDKIEDTDDVLKVVAAKRKKAVSRHGYEIEELDDSPEAKQHAETLEFFYDNLATSRVDDRNVRGGFNMLIRQMMDAVGKKYAVHELVWKPVDGKLTAEFWFVPLWFFENRTGILRYLPAGNTRDGNDLEPGEWMITSGDGVMRAAAVAYMLKHLPLQDWLIYSENFGRPIPKGKSTGNPGSPEWEAMEEAVAALAACDGVVISAGSEIEALDLQVKGNLPYPPLVERMDRAMSTLWRGADLSTMAKGDAVGASVQSDETDILEDDDADNITDVLREQVDRFVIKYMHGTDAPKAHIKIKTGIREDVEGDLKVDQALYEMGLETPLEDLQRRYNRPDLQRKETLPLANEDLGEETEKTLSTLAKNARDALALAIEEDLQPIVDRLTEILGDESLSDDEFFQALEVFQTDELPKLAEEILADPSAADAIADTMAAGLLNGIAEAGEERGWKTGDGGQKTA